MKYLCLVYADEAKLDVMPQHELDALIDEVLAYNEELRASRHLILAEALEHVAAATTVRGSAQERRQATPTTRMSRRIARAVLGRWLVASAQPRRVCSSYERLDQPNLAAAQAARAAG
jgi:hypothetical protein